MKKPTEAVLAKVGIYAGSPRALPRLLASGATGGAGPQGAGLLAKMPLV